MFMGLFKSLKNLFSKKNKKGEKVDVEVKPEVVITNLGVGSDDSVQTTFNTDGINVLVEEGEVENVSD